MFTIPAEWVRHIESHAESTHCVPKKRKRIEVNQNNVNIVREREKNEKNRSNIIGECIAYVKIIIFYFYSIC